MAEPAQQFKLVEETPEQPAGISRASINLLLLSLKTLSQRTLLAIDNLFTLFTVGLVFWVWTMVLDPNPYQIISNSIFAVFVLGANLIVRRK